MWINIYSKLTLYIKKKTDFQENYNVNLLSVNPNYD